MSRTVDFTRPIQKLSPTGQVIGVKWWVEVLKWIAANPGHTSRECRYAICPEVRWGKWDRFATNTWTEAVKKELIVPVRKGRSFVYYCTPKGSYFIGSVMDSLYKRGY